MNLMQDEHRKPLLSEHASDCSTEFNTVFASPAGRQVHVPHRMKGLELDVRYKSIYACMHACFVCPVDPWSSSTSGANTDLAGLRILLASRLIA